YQVLVGSAKFVREELRRSMYRHLLRLMQSPPMMDQERRDIQKRQTRLAIVRDMWSRQSSRIHHQTPSHDARLLGLRRDLNRAQEPPNRVSPGIIRTDSHDYLWPLS